MNVVKEIEQVILETRFVDTDKLGANLLTNAILDRLELLGLDIAEKNDKE